MFKPVVLAAAVVAAAGLTVAAQSGAEAQYYRPGVSIHLGTPYYYGYYGYPYRAYRPYRPYRVYGPAYAYGGPYGPVCARWAWTYNRYGERRRTCIAW
jgi:hypothetical protein